MSRRRNVWRSSVVAPGHALGIFQAIAIGRGLASGSQSRGPCASTTPPPSLHQLRPCSFSAYSLIQSSLALARAALPIIAPHQLPFQPPWRSAVSLSPRPHSRRRAPCPDAAILRPCTSTQTGQDQVRMDCKTERWSTGGITRSGDGGSRIVDKVCSIGDDVPWRPAGWQHASVPGTVPSEQAACRMSP